MPKIKAIRNFPAKAKGSHDGNVPLHDLPEIQIGDEFEASQWRSIVNGKVYYAIAGLPEVRYPFDAFVQV